LTLSKLRNCTIYVGGRISSSLAMRGCENCLVFAKASQVRMDRCHSCVAYLHASTAPVIEYSQEVQFGRFDCSFPEFVAKDFNWLKSTPSPNWTWVGEKLPEGERAEWFVGV
jgi:hypothetical protein